MAQPIDLVITWVDGGDPGHAGKLSSYRHSETLQRPEAAAATRFQQRGELEYCLRSWMKYAPWLRFIFIVTDQQTPKILKNFQDTVWGDKIRLIDHKDIFAGFEEVLPTFNSLTIESMLWRIPHLAENFIYCNDDCFLLQPLKKEDFFEKHKPVIRGQWKVQDKYKWQNRLLQAFSRFLRKDTSILKQENLPKKYNEHRTIQTNSAMLAGENRRFFHLPHVPFPLLKSQFEHYFKKNPQILSENIQHRFRHASQFWPISLMYHLMLQEGDKNQSSDHQAVMINGAAHTQKKILHRLNRARHNRNIVFLCVQSLDEASQETQKIIFDWLGRVIN